MTAVDLNVLDKTQPQDMMMELDTTESRFGVRADGSLLGLFLNVFHFVRHWSDSYFQQRFLTL